MLERLWLLRGDAQLLVCLLLFALALYRGAAPEKILAGALLAVPVVDRIYHFALGPPGSYRGIEVGHLAIDVAFMAVIVPIALRANRVYPLWIGAAQIIALVAHFARAALIRSAPLAYAIMNRIPFYIQIVAVALGLAFQIARTRRSDRKYRDWSN